MNKHPNEYIKLRFIIQSISGGIRRGREGERSPAPHNDTKLVPPGKSPRSSPSPSEHLLARSIDLLRLRALRASNGPPPLRAASYRHNPFNGSVPCARTAAGGVDKPCE